MKSGKSPAGLRSGLATLGCLGLGCLGLGCLSLAAPSLADDGTALDESLRAVVDRYEAEMAEHDIVGGSLVVLQPDRVLVETHFGHANAERGTRTGARTIYAWGSITKTLTTIAVMQLHEAGVLDVDKPYADYVPDFRRVRNGSGNTEKITTRLLLSHLSGLQRSSFIAPLSPFDPWPEWEQILAVMPYIDVVHEPGTKFLYSNLGILLAGRLIDETTLDSYEVYMDKNVYKALGMYDSYYDTTPRHLLAQKAQGYFAAQPGAKRRLYHADYDQGVTTSNGGLKSSVADMQRYARFLLGSRDEAQQRRYDDILPRSVLESLWEPQAPLEDPERGSIGIGFHLFTFPNATYIGHGGSGNGFRAYLWMNRETNLAVLIASNTENAQPVHDAVIGAIDTHLIPDLLER